MAEMHSQTRASSPYELVPNILLYTVNNLQILRIVYLKKLRITGGTGADFSRSH